MLTQAMVYHWLQLLSQNLLQHSEYLNQLDAEIGDADHGVNIQRGCTLLISKLPSLSDMSIAHLLQNLGFVFLSGVGGASGPLYYTLFQRAACSVEGKMTLSVEDLNRALITGQQGIKIRGYVQYQDKTLYDIWYVAAETLQRSVARQHTMAQSLAALNHACQQVAHDSIPWPAKRGRAAYLGEQSCGYLDPGIESSRVIIASLYQAFEHLSAA
ncbi:MULTISPECIES: dihydroxyacetone kinase subunit DhaL [Vibrio]|uniref:dihydroxyacetone kinase subunit DhaL n=1 Tax=Vibrio TaxID=662 RepID=UPI000C16E918|nr:MULTISPECIES: dihydroxyacetone kinase subunit DhaL [Vibrio]NNN44706.1 dihydroxyacetone kinase subunit L [Vibrio sp. 1-1(7)]NNN72079.1 dihydroxyacetone kinase subunit L [Vibrio sp. 12-2(3-a)]